MTDIVVKLIDLQNRLRAAGDICDSHSLESVGGELTEIAKALGDMSIDLTLSLEALGPIFGGAESRSGDLEIMDLCYNAFMIGRNGIPRDPEADRCDWFNDTQPLMRAGVDKIKKDVIRRMEYAKAHQKRDAGTLAKLERERHEAMN